MRIATCFILLIIANFCGVTHAGDLQQAVNGKHRSEGARARDQYRHPVETLKFFDVKPDMTVVEIWPGRGWYSDILAPYLRDKGVYYATGFSQTAKRTPEWRKKMAQELIDKFSANPEIYGKAMVTSLAIPGDINMAPACSADRVLTFRNTHNWIRGDYAKPMFEAIHAALKPGGILGLVQHRGRENISTEEIEKSGYVPESTVIAMAEAAGLKLIDKSEINANPKDSKDHPKGVWTLPPTYRLKDKDRAKYKAIGESDRMTLKFRKTEKCKSKLAF